MLINLILILAIVFCLIAILYILIPKIFLFVSIDLGEIPSTELKEKKKRLIEQKLKREFLNILKNVKNCFQKFIEYFISFFKKKPPLT
jgi:hypothetical protein